jgi:hypothetical protein
MGAGSVAAIGRTPVDAAVSVVTGNDCAPLHWDQGKSDCKPEEPKPDAPPYCACRLGVADCGADPASMPNRSPAVADEPRADAGAAEGPHERLARLVIRPGSEPACPVARQSLRRRA